MLEDIKKIADRITDVVKNDKYGKEIKPDYFASPFNLSIRRPWWPAGIKASPL